MSPTLATKDVHLFKPRKVFRAGFTGGGSTGSAGGHPTGQNPPAGAVVYYWLKTPRQVVTMDFLDSKGAVIRSFTSNQDPTVAVDSVRADSVRAARADSLRRAGVKPDTTTQSETRGEETPEGEDGPRRTPPPPRVANKAGLNMFSWNLRYPDASTFQNMIFWAAGTQGPVAVPGSYSVRINVGGRSETQSFTVVNDPRSAATQAVLADQFAFLIAVRDKTTLANDAIRRIRNVKAQLNDRVAGMPAAQQAAFRAKTDALSGQLSAVEAEIYQVKNQSGQDPLNFPIRLNNKIAALAGVASSADARPTDQTKEVFRTLSAQLDTQLSRLGSALASLGAINTDLKAAGLREIVPSTEEFKDRK
jgi:hypothetical protein